MLLNVILGKLLDLLRGDELALIVDKIVNGMQAIIVFLIIFLKVFMFILYPLTINFILCVY